MGRSGEIRPIEIAEDLEKAVAEIDARGWGRGISESDTGRVCLVGGLNASITGDGRFRGGYVSARQNRRREAAVKEVYQTLVSEGRLKSYENRQFARKGSAAVMDWNDLIASNRRMVLGVLRRTAQRLRGQG